MRRLLGASLGAAAALLLLGLFTGSARAASLNCSEPYALCAEPADSIGYGGEFTGRCRHCYAERSVTPRKRAGDMRKAPT